LQTGDEVCSCRFGFLLMPSHHVHHVPILNAHDVPDIPARAMRVTCKQHGMQ
jgi:hypothetical protein